MRRPAGQSSRTLRPPRPALDEGIEGPQAAVAFIKKRFGIEMNPQYFSAVKSQFKKKAGEAPEGKPGREPKAVPGQAVEGYPPPSPKQPAAGDGDLLDAMAAMKPLIASLGADKVKKIVDLLS